MSDFKRGGGSSLLKELGASVSQYYPLIGSMVVLFALILTLILISMWITGRGKSYRRLHRFQTLSRPPPPPVLLSSVRHVLLLATCSPRSTPTEILNPKPYEPEYLIEP